MQDNGLKEFVRLDLTNKFQSNVDSSIFDLVFIQKDFYMADFLLLENITNFDNFLSKSEPKFNCLQEDFFSFYNFFVESHFIINNLKSDFFFNDVVKLSSLNNLFLLYNSTINLYDRLVWFYCFDFFFFSVFDFCKTFDLSFCYFFEELGRLIFFLEHFSYNLGFILSNSRFYNFPEFFKFFNESFFFFSNTFSKFPFYFISLKNFFYYQVYLNFYDLEYFDFFKKFNDFSIFDSF